MKAYELNSLALRKVGIYFKDVQEIRFQTRAKKDLKEILHTLRIKKSGVPDVLGILNGLTLELNKYYKEVKPVEIPKSVWEGEEIHVK